MPVNDCHWHRPHTSIQTIMTNVTIYKKKKSNENKEEMI